MSVRASKLGLWSPLTHRDARGASGPSRAAREAAGAIRRKIYGLVSQKLLDHTVPSP